MRRRRGSGRGELALRYVNHYYMIFTNMVAMIELASFELAEAKLDNLANTYFVITLA